MCLSQDGEFFGGVQHGERMATCAFRTCLLSGAISWRSGVEGSMERTTWCMLFFCVNRDLSRMIICPVVPGSSLVLHNLASGFGGHATFGGGLEVKKVPPNIWAADKFGGVLACRLQCLILPAAHPADCVGDEVERRHCFLPTKA